MKPAMFAVVSVLLVVGCTSDYPTVPIAPRVFKSVTPSSNADYVLTPAGYYDRTCVYALRPGDLIRRDGSVVDVRGVVRELTTCLRPGPQKLPDIAGGFQSIFPPSRTFTYPADTGWIEFAYYQPTSGQHFHQVDGIWMVPSLPNSSYSNPGKVLYYFLGMQNNNTIVQPVIQYGYNGIFGGAYWTMAPWSCGPTCFHGTPYPITPGDSILGSAYAYNCSGTTCNWAIEVQDQRARTFSSLGIQNGSDNYTLATPGTAEAYGLVSCQEWPVGGALFNAELYDYLGNKLSPTWSKHIDGLVSPQCGFAVEVSPPGTITTVTLRDTLAF